MRIYQNFRVKGSFPFLFPPSFFFNNIKHIYPRIHSGDCLNFDGLLEGKSEG
jgi:hypothetical protein